MTDQETISWMAGLLEGEGCFDMCKFGGKYQYPRIRLAMTDKDVIARFAGLIKRKMGTQKMGKNGKRPIFCAYLIGEPARLLLRKLLPYMGKRRSEKIQKLLASPTKL